MEKKSDFASKIMTNIKKILPHKGQDYKGQGLQKLPENQFDHVLKYLDTKSLLALLFASKTIKKKIIAFIALKYGIKNYDTEKMPLKGNYEESLLRCALMIFLCADRNCTVTWFTEMYVDYKTGKKFDIVYDEGKDNVNKTIKRTLRDFAEKFIKSKNETQYNDFVEKISVMPNIHFLSSGDNNKQLKFIEDIFDAGGFTELEREVMYDDMCSKLDYITWGTAQGNYFIANPDFDNEKAKTKKQIQNYEKIAGKSYKSIYNRLKNNHDPKKPEMENYIKAYEELKKEEGSCNIF